MQKQINALSTMAEASPAPEVPPVQDMGEKEEPASGPAFEPAPEPAEETEEPDVPAEEKRVYLTFDDGPGTQTEKILDVLKAEDVKATFFVIGKEDSYSKKIYKRIVKEGHTLGMHSYSHIYSDLYSSKKAFIKDLNAISSLLEETTGTVPVYYRFPGGSSTTDTEVPIEQLIRVLENRGITYLDWNVISPDAVNASTTKQKMVNGIIDAVSSYDASVVLMYDVADRPMTVSALPEIIQKLKRENYELLPVDEETELIRHNQ